MHGYRHMGHDVALLSYPCLGSHTITPSQMI